MTANIFSNRVVLHGEPAWHQLGKVFQDRVSASEALKIADADFNFFLAPAVAQVETPFGVQLVPAQGKTFIMREPVKGDEEYRITGTASENYELIQNREIAGAIDRLTDIWAVETLGVLGKGETLFLTLDAGEAEVKGEPIHQYFLVADSKDGKTSLKISFTPVRVVCQNTLVTGLRQATVSAALTHKQGIGASFDARIDLVSKMQIARDFTVKTFEVLASAALSDSQVDEVLSYTYPVPNRPQKLELLEGLDETDIAVLGAIYDEASKAQETFEYYTARAQGFQVLAKNLYTKINDEHPAIAGSAYALFNAVVESADYRNGAESMFASTLFGPRAQEKKRAFSKLMSFIG